MSRSQFFLCLNATIPLTITLANEYPSSNETSKLVGCFVFSGPLRQYFSLCRAVSQREGEREEKG